MMRLSFAWILTAVGFLLLAQSPAAQAAATKASPRSKEGKIQSAMSAAPKAIAKDATILDYPAQEGGEMPVLRKGSNEWTCLPDDPKTPGYDPMCLDKMAVKWAQAWMSRTEPQLTSAGLGYMLQGGSTPSNSDPFAKKPPAGEKWMKEAPHLMIFQVGRLDPTVYSSDPHSGGPWIMWGGTPYEHLMVPVK
jgi:hypothetical protein